MENTPTYPCLDADHRYTGCLGDDCPAASCWSSHGKPKPPPQQPPLPTQERKGATCHHCSNLQPTDKAGWSDCTMHHFHHPNTNAAIARQRIDPTAPIPCPDHTEHPATRPELTRRHRHAA